MANPDRPTNFLWVSDRFESYKAVEAMRASGLPFQIFNMDKLQPRDLTPEETPLLTNGDGIYRGVDSIVNYIQTAPGSRNKVTQ